MINFSPAAGTCNSIMCFDKGDVGSWNKKFSTFKIFRLQWARLLLCVFKEKILSIRGCQDSGEDCNLGGRIQGGRGAKRAMFQKNPNWNLFWKKSWYSKKCLLHLWEANSGKTWKISIFNQKNQEKRKIGTRKKTEKSKIMARKSRRRLGSLVATRGGGGGITKRCWSSGSRMI